MNYSWIPLTEYSNKYKVSISTLRRRIRSSRVEFNYSDGKYLLRDAPLTDHQPNIQSIGRSVSAPPQPPTSPNFELEQDQPVQQPPAQPVSPPPPKEKPVEAQQENECRAQATYLNELKRAYSLILQEKEEQALILKDEVADLQTLVKVLESENERLRLENSSFRKRKEPTHVEQVLPHDTWASDLEIE